MSSSINHYKYTCTSNQNTIIDSETVNISDVDNFQALEIKFLDYLFVCKKSPSCLYLVSCIDSNEKYYLNTEKEIQDFILSYFANSYYLVVILNKEQIQFYKIDHQYQFILSNELKIEGLQQPKLYCSLQIGAILIDNSQIYLIQLDNKFIKNQLKQVAKQVIITRCLKYIFILTQESKLQVLSSKTLQIINEHNLKYTESEPLKFQLFEHNNQIDLFTITSQKRIIFWMFEKEDLHTSSLLPSESVKLKFNSSKQQVELIDFQIDSTQNFLFILYQTLDMAIQIYVAQLNQSEIQKKEQSKIKQITKFVKERSSSSFFIQFIIPPEQTTKFLNGDNKCQTEKEYEEFQQAFKDFQYQQLELTDQELPYIFGLQSEKRDKIELCWLYSDLVLGAFLPENLLQLYDQNTSKKKGSSIIQQSHLIPPPYIKEEDIKQLQQQQQWENNSNSNNNNNNNNKNTQNDSSQSQIDPVIKANEIIENELIPKVQQCQQFQVISNDVKKDLIEDITFIFDIKDLIEIQVKKDIDKQGQNDQQALHKLEQQFKQDLCQLESQMENVVTQNLELYQQTCENFLMDNFNQAYFEQLIDDKIGSHLKLLANQQISQNECTQIVQNSTNDYLKDQIGQLYQVELAKMSQGVVLIFEKVIQYFNEMQYIEQTKLQNFNNFIESASQQLQTLSKNISQLAENNRPGQDALQKLDQLILQTEQMTKQYEDAKKGHKLAEFQQQYQQQNISSDDRLSKIEEHIMKLSNDLSMLTQNQQVQIRPVAGIDQFTKGMAAQLTELQIKLTTNQMNLPQIQEILNQVILQIQYFILKVGS